MTRVLSIASTQATTAHADVAQKVIDAFTAAGKSISIYQPIVADTAAAREGAVTATTYDATHTDVTEALGQVVAGMDAQRGADVVIALGTDYSDVSTVGEFDLNMQVAANLNAATLLVLPVDGLAADKVRVAADLAMRQAKAAHAPILGIVAVGAADADATEASLSGVAPFVTAKNDFSGLVAAFDGFSSDVRTPLAFVEMVSDMARREKKTIVLPESMDDRILESAAICTERGTANIILLGEAEVINARCAELGLNIEGVQIVSPNDPELVEKFAAKYAELRAKKGVTIEQARETLKDLSYFGTMMIYFDMADGMVSGAVNTTANTIKPSFEFIKTKPGVKVVSSSFLMCLEDRVLVFGDCAVNPNPTPEQVADIALGCAQTAKDFGIEPRVAMLSYSTAGSGKGPDVDAVIESTRIAKELAPDLALDGPIQFDAAMDMAVGQKKMPGSKVAGQATVFIFPSLEAGNIGYKAVQRTANALAIGPVLQGLNKPVNDLSRGALVEDIVNTVAITAIQAQGEGK